MKLSCTASICSYKLVDGTARRFLPRRSNMRGPGQLVHRPDGHPGRSVDMITVVSCGSGGRSEKCRTSGSALGGSRPRQRRAAARGVLTRPGALPQNRRSERRCSRPVSSRCSPPGAGQFSARDHRRFLATDHRGVSDPQTGAGTATGSDTGVAHAPAPVPEPGCRGRQRAPPFLPPFRPASGHKARLTARSIRRAAGRTRVRWFPYRDGVGRQRGPSAVPSSARGSAPKSGTATASRTGEDDGKRRAGRDTRRGPHPSRLQRWRPLMSRCQTHHRRSSANTDKRLIPRRAERRPRTRLVTLGTVRCRLFVTRARRSWKYHQGRPPASVPDSRALDARLLRRWVVPFPSGGE